MIKFTKMHGLGNDYVYIDCTKREIENPSDLAVKVSANHFGIGSDGLILICKSDVADFKMRMFNKDGSEAQMCGNGIRCVGKFVYDKGLTDKTEIEIETLGGIKSLQLNINDSKVETVMVDMGKPILDPLKIPVKMDGNKLSLYVIDREFDVIPVSMGNPHAVIIVEDVRKFEIEKYGPIIECDMHFPEKINVEFATIVSNNHIIMRIWERGSGETLACGTGACATLVASNLMNLVGRKAKVELLGGILDIEWSEADNHVYMTGPAVTVFEGEIEV